MKPSIYIASKTKHAHRWLAMREQGAPIISTWIYEAGARLNHDDLEAKIVTRSPQESV